MQNSIENFSKAVIPIAAGGFIYIASADLIPELKKDNRITKSIGQLISILIGIGIMYGLTMVE
jgi:zinc and cadmium transporter